MPARLGTKVFAVASLLSLAPGLVASSSAPLAPGSETRLTSGADPPPQFRRGRRAMGMPAEQLVHDFYFTRGIFSGSRRGWSTDAPQADRWITSVMRRLTNIDISPQENFVALDDPALRRFPFLYILEVGGMRLEESEVEGLRNYMLQGGFVMVDDFWGTYEWANWEREIGRVLPEHPIVEIPPTHELFSTLYAVDEIVQVPSVGNARRGITHEEDGYVPYVRGIFDDDGRLMMVINWNTDIGDAWEWAEASYYPLQYSTYAYQVAANTFMYALSH